MNANDFDNLWGAVKFKAKRESSWKSSIEITGIYLGTYIKKGKRFFPIDEFTGIDYPVTSGKPMYIPIVEDCFNNNDTDTFFGLPIFLGDYIKNVEFKSPSDKLRFARKKMYEYLVQASDYEFSCITDLKDDVNLVSFIAEGDSVSYNIDMSSTLRTSLMECRNSEGNKFYLNRKDIVKKVQERVVAQDLQVEAFVNAVYNNQKYGEFEGLKTNVMIIGPTGVGKTETCMTTAKILDVPMIIKDATKYSTTGYVGGDVVSLLDDLLTEANGDVKKAEKGIIVLDEFDKLGEDSASNSSIRTKDVQQELYGLMDRGVYTIKHNKETIKIDTSKITFVFAGAFQRIIDAKSNSKKAIGFNQDDGVLENVVITRDDLHKLGGMEREFLRRVPVIVQMKSLEKEDLKEILTTSKISNLRMWQTALFSTDRIRLSCDTSAIDAIASKSFLTGGGASALKTVVTETLSQILSDAADGVLYNTDVFIDSDTVTDPKKYVKKEQNVKVKKEMRG